MDHGSNVKPKKTSVREDMLKEGPRKKIKNMMTDGETLGKTFANF